MASHSPAKPLSPLSDEQIASLPDLPSAIASIRLYGIKTDGVTNLEEAKTALFRHIRRKVSKSICSYLYVCVCVCGYLLYLVVTQSRVYMTPGETPTHKLLVSKSSLLTLTTVCIYTQPFRLMQLKITF